MNNYCTATSTAVKQSKVCRGVASEYICSYIRYNNEQLCGDSSYGRFPTHRIELTQQVATRRKKRF